MTYQTISLNTHQQQCPIYVGQQLLSQPDMLIPHIAGRQVMIVTQDTIAQHFLKPLQTLLQSYQCDVFYLPNGEQYKTLEQWQKIVESLLHHGHERSTTLIALGGGVVGDITGFAAACFQRGANFIQIPTTLIAQVDAAIGGKTAVNHALGKNLIGTFYQPRCVIADSDTLKTLPQREYNAGLAEVIKYALICDADFFVWLEKNIGLLMKKDSAALLYAISRCVAIKAAIVSQDERDTGVRNLLNLGHTFGHALETANDYHNLLHGEAVAIGIVLASQLSVNLAWLAKEACTRIVNLFSLTGLLNTPFHFPAAQDLMRLMQRDKKVTQGKLNLILLRRIGEAIKTAEVSEEQLQELLSLPLPL